MPAQDLHVGDTAEGRRLAEAEAAGWRRWGPYLSERAWGTVREDYSAGGDAWEYFPHDHARSRAYRWSEDGIAGFSDHHQRWCLALALWNGRDPILKERMFGLTNGQGNHGEDVKELWYYLDGTPTHSYMRTLYKYPQTAYPYEDLIAESARRKATDATAFEYELVDTGAFHDLRYFDVTTEYAKQGPDDVLMRITVVNRGPDAAPLHVLPHLWARNTWSWEPGHPKPQLTYASDRRVTAERPGVDPMAFTATQDAAWLFCDNETNTRRLYGSQDAGYFKDGINDAVVGGDRNALNPRRLGTKCAAHVQLDVAAGAVVVLRFRFGPADAAPLDDAAHDAVFAARIREADEFYAAVQSDFEDADAKMVQRQAFAGMLWSKQYYHFDVRRWLAGDKAMPPPPPERRTGRDSDWKHLVNADIVSMPDKWEYPWYAGWDLAFHCVTFALIDPDFAKAQLILLTREWYMALNGQFPAYEWNFSDVNPPVHGLAAWRVYQIDQATTGVGDRAFLVRVFHKLMINFTWWVNRKDVDGRNIFQGGFLGLDNIGVFDRSKPLPTGGFISQADGTAWMAAYALNLMQIALELAVKDPAYEDIASKFFEHFLYIAEAMTDMGGDAVEGGHVEGLWDEQDGFYYDILNLPDGTRAPLRVRSLVGLIPLCAVAVLDSGSTRRFPAFAERLEWMLKNRPDLAQLVSRWGEPGKENRLLLSLLRRHRMQATMARMLDETEFLSDYGIRAVSKFHKDRPFVYHWNGSDFSVNYEPAESTTTLFGGNSNWRGPIWMPINFVIIEALYEFEKFYSDEDFQVECPKGSGIMMTVSEVAAELTRRLNSIFLRGPDGRRAVFGGDTMFQTDPNFRDHVPFHEYFHGDNGAGLGASHQTGWTGLVALLLQPRRRVDGNLVPATPNKDPSSTGQMPKAQNQDAMDRPPKDTAFATLRRLVSTAVPVGIVTSLLAASSARAAEPRLQDVLSVVTLSFGADGAFDRAVLTQAGDGADLAIYRAVPAAEAGAPALTPAFVKRDIVWSGQMWGTLPSLSVNARGSLVIASENDAIGRDRWHQALTVAYRDSAYLVVGITRDTHDTLDPAAGGSCDLNLSTGRGTAGGKPVALQLAPVPLADWSDDKLPKACRG